MSAHRKSWDKVGKKFEVVGAQVRRLIDEANDDVTADRAAFEKAVHALFSAVDDTLEATSRIVRDPVLRKELADLADAMREAIKVTVGEAREQLSVRSVKAPKALKKVVRKPAATRPATTRPVHRTAAKVAPHAASRKPAASKRP